MIAVICLNIKKKNVRAGTAGITWCCFSGFSRAASGRHDEERAPGMSDLQIILDLPAGIPSLLTSSHYNSPGAVHEKIPAHDPASFAHGDGRGA